MSYHYHLTLNFISKKNPKYKDFLKDKKKYDSLWDDWF